MNDTIPVVALDVPTLEAARAIVAQLDDQCHFYKVGLELFAAEGPAVVEWLRGEGKRVFVDLKLHDIPNTVRSAARSVARLGASLLTVHASGGEAMVRAAVEGAQEGALDVGHRYRDAKGDLTGVRAEGCGILGVTILTSMNALDVGAVWGRESGLRVEEEVVRLARGVERAGALGVVCSGLELRPVKAEFGSRLAALVPGVRLSGGASHDQQRTMTPGDAVRSGADYLVLGRAVTGASDPAEAMAAVWEEIAAV